jgi:hypothetical protein
VTAPGGASPGGGVVPAATDATEQPDATGPGASRFRAPSQRRRGMSRSSTTASCTTDSRSPDARTRQSSSRNARETAAGRST